LGASPETDLWAHFYGLLAGLVLGLAAGLVERRRHALESSRTGQWILFGVALAIIGVAWQIALRA
ncbi:MAG: rhomboid family intramembrane serine protease, partial [Polyangiaceae bacterium]|nr:rhomboid family intramembrane serine protease [Polyangiaceae bacterium]